MSDHHVAACQSRASSYKPVHDAAIRPAGVNHCLDASGEATPRPLICLRAGITDGCGPLTPSALVHAESVSPRGSRVALHCQSAGPQISPCFLTATAACSEFFSNVSCQAAKGRDSSAWEALAGRGLAGRIQACLSRTTCSSYFVRDLRRTTRSERVSGLSWPPEMTALLLHRSARRGLDHTVCCCRTTSHAGRQRQCLGSLGGAAAHGQGCCTGDRACCLAPRGRCCGSQGPFLQLHVDLLQVQTHDNITLGLTAHRGDAVEVSHVLFRPALRVLQLAWPRWQHWLSPSLITPDHHVSVDA